MLAARLDIALPWILAAVAFAVWVVSGIVRRRIARRRELDRLAETWGQPLRSRRSEREPDRWFRHRNTDEDGLDDQTWSDLEMDRVFAWADRTLTALGAQMLYAWLRRPRLELPTHRVTLAEHLAPAPVRTAIQRVLIALGDRTGWDIAVVLGDPGPNLVGPRWLYAALSIAIAPAVAAAAITAHPAALAVALGVCLVNPTLHYLASRRTAGHLAGLSATRRAVRAAARVWDALPVEARAQFPGFDRDLALAQEAIRIESRATTSDPLLDAIAEYHRAFFLTEVNAYLASRRGIEEHGDAIARVVELVGTVDASLSLAHLLAHDERIRQVTPSPSPRTLVATGLVHPLLPEGVRNDVELGPRGLLVTGSNMAGKSTFLRTVGVNAVLAQTLGVACARAFACPPVRVLASMQARDDLGASVSLYRAEVLRILALLRWGTGPTPCLVLLDEVFRGTNPTERIAAAGAVLLELASRNVVVAATHDLELAEITADAYDVGHFTERAGDEGVVFDYRLVAGISRSTNALALLERAGYPEPLVRKAEQIARRLEGGAPQI